MEGKVKYCRFFQKGTCRNGENCSFSHEIQPSGGFQQNQNFHQNQNPQNSGIIPNHNINQNQNSQINHINPNQNPNNSLQNPMSDEFVAQNSQNSSFSNKQEPKICKNFQEGTCKYSNCYSIHAYSQNLDHVVFNDFAKLPIVGMCQISK